MPLNNEKIISIVRDQCTCLDERYEGYRKEIVNIISKIFEEEKKHSISKTNVQQKINEIFKITSQNSIKRQTTDTRIEEQES